MESLQDGNNFLIPSYTNLREQLDSALSPDTASPFYLAKQLLAAAEACEVIFYGLASYILTTA